MAKIPVAQADGEIVFTPGGLKPPRTYQVVKGEIEVADEDMAEMVGFFGPPAPPMSQEDLKAAKAAADQRGYDDAKARQAAIDNQKAVAEATAAGAARAAAELAKSTKTAG